MNNIQFIALLVFFAAMVLITEIFSAHGHEANQPDAAWFNSLQQPNSSIHCCGEADCRAYDERTEVRINDGVYAIFHKGEWLPIEAKRFIETSNPTGHFVACVHDIGDTGYVLCAVKGTGT